MKETKKQIKAQLTNEICKKYEARIEDANKMTATWRGKYFDFVEKHNETAKENNRLREENESLKEQLSQYKDWIDRMQEYCNLPEGERENAVKEYAEYIKLQKASDELLNNISHWTNLLFHL